MLRYLSFESTFDSPDLGSHRAYGLRVLSMQDGQPVELARVPDLSTDSALVERLAELLTMGQLDPLHLPEVVEDFLCTI